MSFFSLTESKLFRFSSILISGTIIAQLIPIILSPILTRQYSPEDFGLFANFMAIVSIMTPLSTGKYDAAIILTHSNKEAHQTLVSTSIIIFLSSFSLFILTYVLIISTPNIEIIQKNKSWISLLAIGVIAAALYQTIIQISAKKKQYSEIARSKVIQGALSTLIPITLFILYESFLWLIAGTIIGTLTAILMLFQKRSFQPISISTFKKTLKKYKNHPKHLLPTDLLNNSSKQGIFFLITILFSPHMAGIYFMTQRIVMTPASLISNSIGQVFYQTFSDILLTQKKRKEARRLLLKTWLILAVLGLPVFSILYIYGPQLFSYIFGDNWAKSGELASILSIYFYASFISSPTSSAFITLRLTKYSFYFGIYVFASRILSITIGYIYSDIMLGFKVLAALEITQITLYNYIIWKKL